jgi:D-alanyl-D-alanine dipeptidase
MRLYSIVAALLAVVLSSGSAFAQSCPALLQGAHRLLLVTVPTMASSVGTLRLFERRQSNAGWRLVGSSEPVMVGKHGLAWGRSFRELAPEQPTKVEGDKRTPAGIYRVGRPFGFDPSPLARYLLVQDDSVCVEEPSSRAYNTITSTKLVGESIEKDRMRASLLYRRGLFVNYPTDRAHRAGSCIFIHIWKRLGSGTDGCVALPEARVATLQRFANRYPTVVAILPVEALGRLGECLPAISAQSHDALQPEPKR